MTKGYNQPAANSTRGGGQQHSHAVRGRGAPTSATSATQSSSVSRPSRGPSMAYPATNSSKLSRGPSAPQANALSSTSTWGSSASQPAAQTSAPPQPASTLETGHVENGVISSSGAPALARDQPTAQKVSPAASSSLGGNVALDDAFPTLGEAKSQPTPKNKKSQQFTRFVPQDVNRSGGQANAANVLNFSYGGARSGRGHLQMDDLLQDIKDARVAVLKKGMWVTRDALELAVYDARGLTGSSAFWEYCKLFKQEFHVDFRVSDVYLAVSRMNRWISAKIHSLIPLSFLTARDVVDALNAEVKKLRQTYPEYKTANDVDQLGLGLIRTQPDLVNKYFFGSVPERIPDVRSIDIFTELYEKRKDQPGGRIEPKELLVSLAKKHNGNNDYGPLGINLTGIGLLVRFSYEGEMRVEKLIEECNKVSVNRTIIPIASLFDPVKLQSNWFCEVEDKIDNLCKAVKDKMRHANDPITIYDVLKHMLFTIQRDRRGRPTESTNKDVAESLSLIVAFLLSGHTDLLDMKGKAHVAWARLHSLETVLGVIDQMIKSRAHNYQGRPVTISELADLEQQMCGRLGVERLEDAHHGSLLHLMMKYPDRASKLLLEQKLKAEATERSSTHNLDMQSIKSAELIKNILDLAKRKKHITSLDDLREIEAEVASKLCVRDFTQMGFGTFLSFINDYKEELLSLTSELCGPGGKKSSTHGGVNEAQVAAFVRTERANGITADEDIRRHMCSQFGVWCMDAAIRVTSTKGLPSVSYLDSFFPLASDSGSGSTPPRQLLGMLDKAPYLTDLSQWLSWDYSYGDMATFLSDKASKADYAIVCDRGGVWVKLPKDVDPATDFRPAVERLDYHAAAANAASYVLSVKQAERAAGVDRLHNVTREALKGLAGDASDVSKKIDRFVLGCIKQTPKSLRTFLYKQLYKPVLDEFAGALTVSRLRDACVDVTEHMALLSVGIEYCPAEHVAQVLVVEQTTLAAADATNAEPAAPSTDSTSSVVASVVSQPTDNTSNNTAIPDTKEEPDDIPVCDEVVARAIVQEQNDEMSKISDVAKKALEGALGASAAALYDKDFHCVYELVQNADDNTYPSNVEPTLVFVIDQERMVIYNNECGFTKNHMLSLCSMGQSSKRRTRGMIGQKGIGFKSVYKISQAPEVHSGAFHVKFDISETKLGYCMPQWVENWRDGPAGILPECVSKLGMDTSEFRTCIVLPWNLRGKAAISTSASALDAVQATLLLFLYRLKTIAVFDNVTNKHIVYKKKVSAVHPNITVLCSGEVESQWLVNTRQFQPAQPRPIVGSSETMEVKESVLCTAIPYSDVERRCRYRQYSYELPRQYAYAFLPIRSYGFPFVVQGDFLLSSSREGIDEGQSWNLALKSQLKGNRTSVSVCLESILKLKDQLLTESEDATVLPPTAVSVCLACLDVVPVPTDNMEFFSDVAESVCKALTNKPILRSQSGLWVKPNECISYDRDLAELCPELLLVKHLPTLERKYVLLSTLYASRKWPQFNLALGPKGLDVHDVYYYPSVLLDILKAALVEFGPTANKTITLVEDEQRENNMKRLLAIQDDAESTEGCVSVPVIKSEGNDRDSDKCVKQVTINSEWYVKLMCKVLRIITADHALLAEGEAERCLKQLKSLALVPVKSVTGEVKHRSIVEEDTMLYLLESQDKDLAGLVSELFKTAAHSFEIVDSTFISTPEVSEMLTDLGVKKLTRKTVVYDLVLPLLETNGTELSVSDVIVCNRAMAMYTSELSQSDEKLKEKLAQCGVVVCGDGVVRHVSQDVHFDPDNNCAGLANAFSLLGLTYITVHKDHISMPVAPAKPAKSKGKSLAPVTAVTRDQMCTFCRDYLGLRVLNVERKETKLTTHELKPGMLRKEDWAKVEDGSYVSDAVWTVVDYEAPVIQQYIHKVTTDTPSSEVLQKLCGVQESLGKCWSDLKGFLKKQYYLPDLSGGQYANVSGYETKPSSGSRSRIDSQERSTLGELLLTRWLVTSNNTLACPADCYLDTSDNRKLLVDFRQPVRLDRDMATSLMVRVVVSEEYVLSTMFAEWAKSTSLTLGKEQLIALYEFVSRDITHDQKVNPTTHLNRALVFVPHIQDTADDLSRAPEWTGRFYSAYSLQDLEVYLRDSPEGILTQCRVSYDLGDLWPVLESLYPTSVIEMFRSLGCVEYPPVELLFKVIEKSWKKQVDKLEGACEKLVARVVAEHEGTGKRSLIPLGKCLITTKHTLVDPKTADLACVVNGHDKMLAEECGTIVTLVKEGAFTDLAIILGVKPLRFVVKRVEFEALFEGVRYNMPAFSPELRDKVSQFVRRVQRWLLGTHKDLYLERAPAMREFFKNLVVEYSKAVKAKPLSLAYEGPVGTKTDSKFVNALAKQDDHVWYVKVDEKAPLVDVVNPLVDELAYVVCTQIPSLDLKQIVRAVNDSSYDEEALPFPEDGLEGDNTYAEWSWKDTSLVAEAVVPDLVLHSEAPNVTQVVDDDFVVPDLPISQDDIDQAEKSAQKKHEPVAKAANGLMPIAPVGGASSCSDAHVGGSGDGDQGGHSGDGSGHAQHTSDIGPVVTVVVAGTDQPTSANTEAPMNPSQVQAALETRDIATIAPAEGEADSTTLILGAHVDSDTPIFLDGNAAMSTEAMNKLLAEIIMNDFSESCRPIIIRQSKACTLQTPTPILMKPTDEQVNNQNIGKVGERLAYEWLRDKYKNNSEVEVEWINKDSEKGLPYDISVRDKKTRHVVELVEVKSTVLPLNDPSVATMHFPISEIRAMIHAKDSYSVCRVTDVASGQAKLLYFKNFLNLVDKNLVDFYGTVRMEEKKQ